eukprot:11164614-Prorocentrum_lima.AAC.1
MTSSPFSSVSTTNSALVSASQIPRPVPSPHSESLSTRDEHRAQDCRRGTGDGAARLPRTPH